jgi:cyclophilin family peptidyl-prolyl cis-trans isomerase
VKREAVSTSVAAALLVVGILIVAAGYYAVTVLAIGKTGTTTVTATPTVTQAITTSAANPSAGTYVKIGTSMGTIEVQLFPTSAPKTVANFVNLTNSGFYNNLVWHRIVKGFVIQTGDPNTRNGGDRSLWGTGASSQSVPLEIDPSLHNYAGYLGMARGSDPNSGSSQFYINLANNTSLDGQYTVFGKVIAGMDVVQAIAGVPVNSQDQPISPVFVTSITIQSSP